MFSVAEYCHSLNVSPEDDTLTRAKEIIELTELICDDAWLARQDHFGSAGAMERQLEYLGGTLLPNAESKLNRLEGRGILSESDLSVSWHSNEDHVHENDEIPVDQQIDEQKNFIDQLKDRMRTAAILFVTRVHAHDEISKMLDQLTYSAIKARAQSNRAARSA